jgi:hypothetical protein
MPRLLPDRFAPECIREFDFAADERYADAIHLADGNRRTGAIYLFGYVVEMLLKAAFLRLAGHADDDTISAKTLWSYAGQHPTTTARALGLPGAANLHDLSAWADLIVAYRASRALVYPDSNFAAVLLVNIAAVSVRWTEVIRYHKNVAYEHELNRVRTSCAWVLAHRRAI